MLTTITADIVKHKWEACYPPERIDALFPIAHNPLEILTLQDGLWGEVPPQDRIWGVCRDEVLPPQLLRLFACWCASQTLPIFERYRPNDDRPRNTIEVVRRFAYGAATEEELIAAWVSAWTAATNTIEVAARAFEAIAWAVRACARDTARDTFWAAIEATARAAEAAARTPATDAAEDAADISVWTAAEFDAGCDAAEAMRKAQVEKLTDMVRVYVETGDVYGGERASAIDSSRDIRDE